ncbi:Leucoanthocyanidin dioxygenase [Morus notabilis]|uniref:Leucoanthocyanidin dioxygenase n=1 Tax=Morus notabilis TaxID=981085 RepID=W9SJZ3_9ROSA|nr:Leucoanthocyanidin dioxygenase [Morus notabilis]
MAALISDVSINQKPYCYNTTKAAYNYDHEQYDVPTIDYFMLFSNDPNQRSKALNYLRHVCQDYGFFYLVNHGITDNVFESVFKGISDFFDPIEVEDRRQYEKKNPTDRIRWGLRSSPGENREYLKVVAHPRFHCPPKPADFSVFKGISDFFDPIEVEDRRQYEKKNPTDRIRWGLRSSPGENREYLKVVAHPRFHCPPKPADFSEAMEEYFKRLREVVRGLGKAVSKTLGFEECYIEKAFNLESGFDVSAMNLYPPNFQSKGAVGVPDHTDPGFFVSLVQDVNGGLQILSNAGNWIDVYDMPPNAIFINLGDHLEILTNGKYKSHVHRVVVDNNKVKRISVATLHGPSLDTFVKPAPEFVDDSHPPAYRGATYKRSLEANGDEIDVQSSIDQLRLQVI